MGLLVVSLICLFQIKLLKSSIARLMALSTILKISLCCECVLEGDHQLWYGDGATVTGPEQHELRILPVFRPVQIVLQFITVLGNMTIFIPHRYQ